MLKHGVSPKFFYPKEIIFEEIGYDITNIFLLAKKEGG